MNPIVIAGLALGAYLFATSGKKQGVTITVPSAKPDAVRQVPEGSVKRRKVGSELLRSLCDMRDALEQVDAMGNFEAVVAEVGPVLIEVIEE